MAATKHAPRSKQFLIGLLLSLAVVMLFGDECQAQAIVREIREHYRFRDQITKQVDFEKEFLLMFYWTGSVKDQFSFEIGGAKKDPVVEFNYKPGNFNVPTRHFHFVAVSKPATWRAPADSPIAQPTRITSADELAKALFAVTKGEWNSVEIVKLVDFDDVDVKFDGLPLKAFLVGLQPLKESVKDSKERNRVRMEIADKLRKSALSARVITERGDRYGLSVDTFQHHRNDFKHGSDSNTYPYCWSGWFAYNFNTYFLHTKVTTFVDNLGDGKEWEGYRESFKKAVKKIAGANK